jgi:hypothetical protein
MIRIGRHCNDGFVRLFMLCVFCREYKVMVSAILLMFASRSEVQAFILKRCLQCEYGTATALVESPGRHHRVDMSEEVDIDHELSSLIATRRYEPWPNPHTLHHQTFENEPPKLIFSQHLPS